MIIPFIDDEITCAGVPRIQEFLCCVNIREDRNKGNDEAQDPNSNYQGDDNIAAEKYNYLMFTLSPLKELLCSQKHCPPQHPWMLRKDVVLAMLY